MVSRSKNNDRIPFFSGRELSEIGRTT
ncbi:unnamed protein product [Linum tenue]|uniref:Uncharacterized protein n=1 Tax=Linum tenue TaxID=586396 RepID=A0AAV0QFR1_9ROSI|nr:unnamed protein product [Linum tenue]